MVALLVLLAFAKGLLWLGAYPVFKIADEPAHFDNVQYRAEHHQWAPQPTRTLDKVMSPTSSVELRAAWAATQKYHRQKHSRYFPMVEEEAKLAKLAKEDKNRLTDGQMPALMYPGGYDSLATIPYLLLQTRSVLNRVFAVRALSMLFGLCAVLATFFAGRATFDAPELAFAAACIVCMQPMFSQQTAAVNNDAALIGWCAISFALQVMLLRGRPSLLYGALIGVTVGLSITSKPQGWLMLFTAFLVFSWLTYKLGRAAWRVWAGAAAAGVVVILVVSLWPSAPPPVTAPIIAVAAPSPAPVAHKVEDGPVTKMLAEVSGFPAWVDSLDADYREYLFRSAFGQFSWLEFSASRLLDAGAEEPAAVLLLRPDHRAGGSSLAAAVGARLLEHRAGGAGGDHHVLRPGGRPLRRVPRAHRLTPRGRDSGTQFSLRHSRLRGAGGAGAGLDGAAKAARPDRRHDRHRQHLSERRVAGVHREAALWRMID